LGQRRVREGGRLVRNRAAKGVETSNAERFASRRRVSTAGLEDSLPKKRLRE
jgi:hypothetical protein